MKIDPNKTWKRVEERLATETDPVLRRNLEIVRDHMKAEACGDIDRLMQTLSAHPAYHAYGAPPEYSPEGTESIRSFYDAFVASGAGRLEFDLDRLLVDRHCVLTEGTMRMAYPGRILHLLGIEVDEENELYMFETRMAVLWPIDDAGKILGEDTYAEGDGFFGIENRKLGPGDIGSVTDA